MPLNPSEPPHWKSDGERGERRRRSLGAIGLSQRGEGLVQRQLHQRRFAAGALLIDDHHRLAQLRIAGPQLFHEHVRLRVLAAKA